jgi:hypothetical protein
MKFSAPDLCDSNGGEGMLYHPGPCQLGLLFGGHRGSKEAAQKAAAVARPCPLILHRSAYFRNNSSMINQLLTEQCEIS